jgi:hypothetical protein
MSFEEYLMAPHYDRHADPSAAQNDAHIAAAGGIDEAAMDVAAEALREVEVEAAQPEPEIPDVSSLDAIELESMNRATFTEKEELLAAIRQRFASST